MKSLERYISTRILVGSALILAAGTFILGWAMRTLDMIEFDEALEQKARTLAMLMEREDRTIEIEVSGKSFSEYRAGHDEDYFQFRLPDGSLIMRSENLGERDLPTISGESRSPIFRNLHLPSGERGRFVQIMVLPRAGGASFTPGESRANSSDEVYFNIPDSVPLENLMVVVGVARSRRALDDLLLKVYGILAGMDVLLIGLVSVLVRRSFRKGFQSIEQINAQIRGLGARTLDRRVVVEDAPTELSVVLNALNGFIDRLEAAFQRERNFTSDAAHELRTPVAEFRAACEVGARWAEDPALVRRRFENLQESAANMERILTGLLDLSRFDRGQVPLELSPTRLAASVETCWARVCSGGAGGEHRLENRVDRSFLASTDPHKLEQILVNLLSNAARYSPAASVITCTGGATEENGWELCISNPVQDLEVGDLGRLFDRFWGKDSARTGGQHAGLGLSIARALADLLGIQLQVDLSPDKVFAVRLRFPGRDESQEVGVR